MKKVTMVFLVVGLVAASFMAGMSFNAQSGGQPGNSFPSIYTPTWYLTPPEVSAQMVATTCTVTMGAAIDSCWSKCRTAVQQTHLTADTTAFTACTWGCQYYKSIISGCKGQIIVE